MADRKNGNHRRRGGPPKRRLGNAAHAQGNESTMPGVGSRAVRLVTAAALAFSVCVPIVQSAQVPAYAAQGGKAQYLTDEAQVGNEIDEKLAPKDGGLEDSGHVLLVKNLMADADALGGHESFEDVYDEDALAYMGQYTSAVALYDPGEESPYLVGDVGKAQENGTGKIVDWAFTEGLDSVDPQTAEGARVDGEAGIAYVPKELLEDGGVVQAQILVAADAGDETTELDVAIDNQNGGVTAASPLQQVEAPTYDVTVTVPVATPATAGSISLADLVVCLDGTGGTPLELDADNAVYDTSTGNLTLAASPCTLTRIDIAIRDNGARGAERAYAVSKSDGVEDAADLRILKDCDGNRVEFEDASADDFKAKDLFTWKGKIRYGNVDRDDDSGWRGAAQHAKAYMYQTWNDQAIDWTYNKLMNDSMTFDKWVDDGDNPALRFGQTALSDDMADFAIVPPDSATLKQRGGSAVSDGGKVDLSISGQQVDAGAKAYRNALSLVCGHISNPISSSVTRVSDSLHEGTCGMRVLYVDADAGYAVVGFVTAEVFTQAGAGVYKIGVAPSNGYASLKKKSSYKAMTDDNPYYGLAGAKYGVYETKADANANKDKVGTLTTKANGESNALEVKKGTYYIKETSAPDGYKTDDEVYTCKVKAGKETEVEVADDPIAKSISVLLYKQGDANIPGEADGDATLSGAVFKVEYHKSEPKSATNKAPKDASVARTWYLKTDKDGKVEPAGSSALASGYDSDPFYKIDGKVVFPAGAYTVTEVKAPEGYLVAAVPCYISIAFSGTKPVVTASFTNEGDAEHLAVCETPKRGGFLVGKGDALPYDAEKTGGEGTYYNLAQGDATLAGAEFTVTNRSASAIWYDANGNGKKDYPAERFAPGTAVTTIKTAYDASLDAYVARTPERALPFGTYEVSETRPPEGYQAKGTLKKTVKIEADGQYDTLVEADGMLNEVVRGDVQVTKKDHETRQSQATGGAGHSDIDAPGYQGSSLTGIEFTIWNRSEHGVMADGAWHKSGDVVCKLRTHWNDEKGAYTAETEGARLPYGTYEIAETATNDSYLLTDGAPKTFTVREHGTVTIRDTADGDLDFFDRVVRSDVSFQKKATRGSKKLAGVPFLVTNVTTGEAHVVVTDRNGQADTSAGKVSHAKDTNANDGLVEKAKAGEAIAAADVNMGAGVWFGLAEDGARAAPDDAWGALPYGAYTVEELRCEANEGLQLVSDTFFVERDLTVTKAIDLGTMDDDDEPMLHTTATDKADGDKYVAADGTATVVDKVDYYNLVPGLAYTMRGTLMDKKSGEAVKDADGNAVAAEKRFTPDMPIGSVELEFSFDATGRNGDDFVVFERALDAQGKAVAVHENLTDEGQTVTAEHEIGTTASDKADGDKHLSASGQATVVDAVAYRGLTAGRAYIVSGTLMDREAKAPVQDAEGNAVAAKASFVPDAPDGTVELEFTFDASAHAGGNLVAFERLLTVEGDVAGRHEDYGDEGQTAHVPKIGTMLTDADDGDHHIAAGKVEVVDEIAYSGLAVGSEYTATLTLVDKGSGVPVKGAGGKEVTASATFTPEASDGTVQVMAEIDASALAGKALVAFEELAFEGRVVAEHKDPDDERQTVHVPAIGTTLTERDAGGHSAVAARELVLVDVIAYEGLIPGTEYTAVGTLVSKDDGKPLQEHGEDVTATAQFTPEEATGSVKVAFAFDASALAGKGVVAFEKVSAAGVVVAAHEDIDDEGQTVDIEEPKIGTTLTDATDGDHEALPSTSITLTDTIAYEGLVPGEAYTATGTLMDKKSGKAVRVANADVTAQAMFTPTEVSGTAEVTFTFDASSLAGHKLVAFEQLSRAGIVVATHEDIDDKDQTVAISPTGGKTPGGKTPGGSTTTGSPWPKTGVDTWPILAATAALAAVGAGLVGYGLWRRRKNAAAADAEETAEAGIEE